MLNEGATTNDELDSASAAIYAGPLDGFIARRDALAKELRAAGRRADAATVKVLRKPARMAWALDSAAVNDPDIVERVAAAVAAALAAQSGGGDVRTTLAQLREAVQILADAASHSAASHGTSVDRGELSNAVMAVIGVPAAFDLLRAGRLADIPEAGGTDILASPVASATSPAATVEPVADRGAEEVASRETLRSAEVALAAARERAASADRAFRIATANAESAERRLVSAQQEAQARQAERDRARDDAIDAAAALLEAERAVATARRPAGSG
jgi:hypothetical protein